MSGCVIDKAKRGCKTHSDQKLKVKYCPRPVLAVPLCRIFFGVFFKNIFFMRNLHKTQRRVTCNQAGRAFFPRLSKFPRKTKDHPAAQSTTPISCAALICINVSKGCRSILAGAFIGCAAVKQHWRIRRANARKGREKTNTISAFCSSILP